MRWRATVWRVITLWGATEKRLTFLSQYWKNRQFYRALILFWSTVVPALNHITFLILFYVHLSILGFGWFKGEQTFFYSGLYRILLEEGWGGVLILKGKEEKREMITSFPYILVSKWWWSRKAWLKITTMVILFPFSLLS